MSHPTQCITLLLQHVSDTSFILRTVPASNSPLAQSTNLHTQNFVHLLLRVSGLLRTRSPAGKQDFILPALLYLTAKRPRPWVWALNITITVIYTCVATVGAVGAFKLIIEVRHIR